MRKNYLLQAEAKNRIFAGGGKLYRTISSIAIAGLFLAVGIIILAVMQMFNMSVTLGCSVAVIAIICSSCLIALPWIRLIERGEFKRTSIVFLCLDIVCGLLWIVCAILVSSIITKSINGTMTETYAYNTLRLIKVTLVITVQFFVSSFIGTGITKYRSTMVAFQVIAYLSYLLFDFFVSIILFCVEFSGGEINFNSELFAVINNRPMWTLFVVSIFYCAISSGIMNRQVLRRAKNMADDAFMDSVKDEVELRKAQREGKDVVDLTEAKNESAEEKLEKLKNMYEKELITKEEYEEKRKNILKDM